MFKKSVHGTSKFVPQVQEIGNDILRLYTQSANTAFEKTSELERQILSVYLFGMANGLPEQVKGTPLNMETGMVAVLVSIFQYSVPQAQDFVRGMISDLQSKDKTNTIYAIIHRGLDGYSAYKDGQKEKVIADISNIISSLR
jgi:hypothetical protein